MWKWLYAVIGCSEEPLYCLWTQIAVGFPRYQSTTLLAEGAEDSTLEGRYQLVA